MFNWFDLMSSPQDNTDLDALARHFKVTSEQAQQAMAAFLPAFAMGLQQSPNPAQYMQALAGTPFSAFLNSAAHAFTPQAQQAGKQILDQLFGSDEVSRRVAHQAADFTGIGVETMHQMLPLMAGILAGSYSQWLKTNGYLTQASSPDGTKPQQDINPWNWASWMNQPSLQNAQTPLEAMMAPFMPKTEKATDTSTSEAWGEFVGKGHELQQQYLASLQSMFASSLNRKN